MKNRARKLLAGVCCLLLAAGGCLSAGAEKTVTLTFTGDVTLGSEEINRNKPESFDSYAEREGYDYFFRNMQPLFTADDLTLVNLEGVLSDSGLEEDLGKTFRFRGPTKFAKILTISSIEACAISNNHIKDYGRQGYQSTVATLRENDIQVCGNDYSFIFEKDGIKIGFFALGSTFFTSYRDRTEKAIAKMRAEGVNAIVCSFHAGQEYAPKRRDRDQERFAKIAIEQWGADLVIMHHPHVVQGIDIRNDRYIFYSLGNFCFGGNMFIRGQQRKKVTVRTLESMVVQMDLRFTDDGEYLGQSGRIYPCYISSSAAKIGDPNDFQPKLVTGEEAQGVLDRIQYDTRFDLGKINEETGYLELAYLGKDAPEISAKKTETVPTAELTASPTETPTAEPTAPPTAEPTVAPTAGPTATPAAEPGITPPVIYTVNLSGQQEKIP